jgi:hypothetical protein
MLFFEDELEGLPESDIDKTFANATKQPLEVKLQEVARKYPELHQWKDKKIDSVNGANSGRL